MVASELSLAGKVEVFFGCSKGAAPPDVKPASSSAVVSALVPLGAEVVGVDGWGFNASKMSTLGGFVSVDDDSFAVEVV